MGLRNIIGKDTWLRTTYREIKNFYYDQREGHFLHSTLADVPHFNCRYEQPPPLLLITVVYNRADMIEHQLRLLPKYLSDSFRHIVVDNSRSKSARKAIEQLCEQYGTGYVSLPGNFYTHASNSHGLALNWAYQHLVKMINPYCVGFLDHDIFPVRSHSILKYLTNQPCYGEQDTREDIWYLWPGFSFYHTALLGSLSVDFKPGVIGNTLVDTGGLIQLDALLSKDHLLFAEGYHTSVQSGSIPHLHKIEWIQVDGVDTWFHCIGAGHWTGAETKEQIIDRLLATY